MKFVLLTVLLVASAFAYDHGFRSRVQVGASEETIAFTKGFLTGVGESSVFDQIRVCVADSETFFKDIATGFALIKTKNPAKVKEGVALLGKAVKLIPTAAQDCKAAEKDIKKLIQLAKAFTNPVTFLYSVGKSLLINRIEVLHQVNNAIQAYDKRDFFNVGYWVGKAMDTIFLGFNQPIKQDFINFVNSAQSSWTAGVNPKFEGMTLAQIKAQFLGALPSYEINEETVLDYEGLNDEIPANFNSSIQWPGCVHPIRDQGRCGSCWAFAASEVLSDRFCIVSNNKIDVVLSPQYLVSCDTANLGCNGGWPVVAWNFVVRNGLPTDSCYPYVSGDGTNPKCNAGKCQDGTEWTVYRGKSIVTLINPTSIQQNILQYGPVEAAFSVYQDFLSYKSGIYKHVSGGLLGGHAVKIVGWGREESTGTNYWIVHNSWDVTWGEDGLFRIAFGECGIDRAVTAVQADLTSVAGRNPFRRFQKF